LTGTIHQLQEQVNLLNLKEGTYQMELSNNLGITASQVIIIPSFPTVAIASSLSDYNGYSVSCAEAADGSIQLLPLDSTAELRYRWNDGSTTNALHQIPAGNYQVAIFDSYDCQQDINFRLTAPLPLTLDLAVENPLCYEDELGQMIINEVNNHVGEMAYSFDGIDYTTITQTPYTLPLPPNEYALLLQDEQDCQLTTILEITPAMKLQIDLGKPQTIKLGEKIQIEPKANFDIKRLEWSANDPTFYCYKCHILDFQPIQSDTYSVKAYDPNDCLIEDKITILVDKQRQTYFPTGFSPNADGINDYYQPYFGPSVAKVYVFQIGDDQGRLLFQAKNFAPSNTAIRWDGRFHNKLLLSNHYMAMVEVGLIDGTRERYVQTFNLIR